MFNFTGRTVIVTGAAKGIGKQIAKSFYDAGANLALCSVERDYSDEILTEIAGANRERIFGMAADLTKMDALDGFMKEAVKRFGQIDVLVNNAGVYMVTPSVDVTESQWDLTLDVNLKSQFFCSQFAAKNMIERNKPGTIINIASINAQSVVPNSTAYCVSKAGVQMLTKCLAKDWGEFGIRVNAVGPGSIPTDINKDIYQQPGKLEALKSRLPLGRQGTVGEIANAVLFLASEEASYITGQTLFVDGGWLLS
ncbi:SDR family oxidoreductase [Aminipila butyrica]|uniref:SDR family oxidoreductase n=1 Tax=Aminipila butyrica TaxID=433296 RepID=A0A858C0Y4_9FIRM|nr:SDR family oxidoreductase [Aminipila butyrica]QIB70066.1 SDR family oxidoreductase [Aminipila butyrica]